MDDDLARFVMGMVAIIVIGVLLLFWWACPGFDRAKSSGVDSTVGDDCKSSKFHNCKRWVIFFSRLRLRCSRTYCIKETTRTRFGGFLISSNTNKNSYFSLCYLGNGNIYKRYIQCQFNIGELLWNGLHLKQAICVLVSKSRCILLIVNSHINQKGCFGNLF